MSDVGPLLYFTGKQLPNPKIKATKQIGDTLIHKLSWGDENGGDWVGEDFFKLLGEGDEGEIVSNLSTCNTRKSQDKRQNVHSVGVFTGAYPCGVIVLGDELYTSESISQVYGILTDFVSALSDKSKLKQILYDDMCHLKRFCDDPQRANQNEVTEVISRLSKHVDKFHFANHKDQWCQDNCNPDSVQELEGVNSQVCEQLFKKINAHKNCRKMNEGRFSLFFLYQYDIHNLDIEKKTILADPRADVRWENITITDPIVEMEEVPQEPTIVEKGEVSQESTEKQTENQVEVIAEAVKTSKLSATFTCPECKAKYKKEGFFKKHLADVHGKGSADKSSDSGDKSSGGGKSLICDFCEKVLSSTQALLRHIKTHKKCNICKEEFESVAEATIHSKTHTTCAICDYDFKSSSNYKRHMKDLHKKVI